MQLLRLLIICCFFVGCSKRKVLDSSAFLSVSLTSDVNISMKTHFNDTIFVEKRYTDSIEYSYATLSKKQKNVFKDLISNLEKQKSEKDFELSEGEQVFILVSNELNFYVKRHFLNESSFDDLNIFMLQLNFTKMDTIKKFWNINGIVEVPFPSKMIDESIFNSKDH